VRGNAAVRALIAGGLLLASVACTGGGEAIPTAPAPVRGGRVVFGVEQWPECVNPILVCGTGSLWTTVFNNVLPFALDLDVAGNHVPSPLIHEVPSLENGGLQQSPFTVTYHLDPRAVWADGTPITSADFDFTWDAFLHTRGTASTTGYRDISSIDTSDPHTVVIRFNHPFGPWADVFGGGGGALLERAAFPKENGNVGHVDLSREMEDSVPFSGGPWILASWDRQQAILVRNERYWGHQPYLDQVTFIPRVDPATAIVSVLSGEISAMLEMGSDVSFADEFAGHSEIRVAGGPGPNFEALWFNQSKPPLDDPMVREAFMYAVDRQAIVDAIIKPNDPNAQVVNCGFVALPSIGPWCQGPRGTPFAPFHYDPKMVATILEKDGYHLGSDGYFQKDGRDLTIDWSTTSGNRRRETTQALEIEKARLVGIKLTTSNSSAELLFADRFPANDVQMSMAASAVYVDPSVEAIFACDQIPNSANAYSGYNYSRWCDPRADDLMHRADQEIDLDVRLDLVQSLYALEAEDFMGLPLFSPPALAAWRTDRLAGPVGEWLTSGQGLFWNMDEWYCARPGACG
jgi:peptide/nickel transport system substrate-binding protein